MSNANNLSKLMRIPRLQKAKGFTLWRIYIMKLIQKDHILKVKRMILCTHSQGLLMESNVLNEMTLGQAFILFSLLAMSQLYY